MRIAQISPLMESVPPRLYGGTEPVVSYLTEELVQQGHEVTLFASGDSITEARLMCTKRALRLCGVDDIVPYHLIMLDRVARSADELDILHFHIDALHYPVISRFARRTVTTWHGRLDLPDLHALYAAFDHVPLVSISSSQWRPMPPVNWGGCVHHGLPRDLLTAHRRSPNSESSWYRHSDGYLAFLGRISPEKRADRAIKIAVRTGRELRIAAKIDKVDRTYWRDEIEPLVSRHPNVRYVGEISEADKADFLGNAAALLFPIDWAEPFGLTMIEAMACGTPVIAWDIASVPEVVDDGVTGFVVGSINDAVEAVRRLPDLDRRAVRAVFERRFTARRMARDYIAIYRRRLADEGWPRAINGSRVDEAMQ